MSGEDTDKGLEIWFKLLLNGDFLKDLDSLKTKRDTSEYYLHREFLFGKYNQIASNRLRQLCDEYVFGSEAAKNKPHYQIKVQTPSKAELQKEGRSFVKLWLYDGVARDEMIDYIKQNWQFLKKIRDVQGMPKVKRVRKFKDKELIIHVLEYNKNSMDQLRDLANENSKNIYREILISRLLRENHDIDATPDTIKGIITRFT